jgi:hypothetical protein
MATTMDVQALLRFLTTSAKLPLATAMGKMKELRAAEVNRLVYQQGENYSPRPLTICRIDDLVPAKLSKLQEIFGDEKTAKQVLNAAKRNSKKRDAPSGQASPAKKKARTAPGEVLSPADLEDSLALPEAVKDEEVLSKAVMISNRAPLVLAFALTLLKYTMPEQPLSSRLSLAQAYVSGSSRDRAVYLGLESGKSAEQEGFGQGQPIVRIMGRDVRVMRRWGYDPTSTGDAVEEDTQQTQSTATVSREKQQDVMAETEPPLWGLDLEALRKSSTERGSRASNNNLPIHTPQSARAYIIKAFNNPPNVEEGNESTSKKGSKGGKPSVLAQRERNLGLLLGALELLYESWAGTLDPAEMDKHTWRWYVEVRPAVADGVDGWGGKNEIRLENILKLRRQL